MIGHKVLEKFKVRSNPAMRIALLFTTFFNNTQVRRTIKVPCSAEIILMDSMLLPKILNQSAIRYSAPGVVN